MLIRYSRLDTKVELLKQEDKFTNIVDLCFKWLLGDYQWKIQECGAQGDCSA